MKTILITVDSLRADRLGSYDYKRDTMPALKRLTDAGTTFKNTFSNAPYTRISIPSFHTSRYLAYNRIDQYPTLPEVLQKNDTMTAAIGTQTGIDLIEGDFGYGEMVDLGRDEYYENAKKNREISEQIVDVLDSTASSIGSRLSAIDPVYRGTKAIYQRLPISSLGFSLLGYTSAKRVTDCTIEWLDEHHDEDFFLWVHYMEAHRPYGVHDDSPAFTDEKPSEEEIQRLMKKAGLRPDDITADEHRLLSDLYDSDLRYCSKHMDRLFDQMDSLDIWDETDVIFTSDHGEEFYEHGAYFHRNLPYDVLTHIPLIFKTDSETQDSIDEQRQLLDLVPTVCERHGIPTDEFSFEGVPLFNPKDRDIILLGSGHPDDEQVVGLRSDGWKYLHDGDTDLLFNLTDDPAESHNVASDHPSVVNNMKSDIPKYLFDRTEEELREPDDEVDRERLEALGYLELKE